jgi:FKBP-type peptidyl-prolyl cis-trans isomerase
MKFFKISVIALCALVCATSAADAKKKAKKSKAKTEKVDTVSVKDFSYAIGMANTQGLDNYLQRQMDVDPTLMDDFVKGFNAYGNNTADKKAIAYAAGLRIHQQVSNTVATNIDRNITGNDSTKVLDRDQFVKGFVAGLTNDKSKMTIDSAGKIANNQMMYYHHVQTLAKYGDNLKAGEAFLKANAKKDSVKVFPDGVQYKVLVKGTGVMPKDTSEVTVNYEGRTIDGKVFDSSYKTKRPATFRCNQVIKGWAEAVTHMTEGSKWEVFIPQNLAYGDREMGQDIKPYSALIFTVELIKVKK